MAVPTSGELLELAYLKAQSPKSARSLDKSVEEHDLGDLIDAAFKLTDRAVDGTRAAPGLRFTKMVPPGGGGD